MIDVLKLILNLKKKIKNIQCMMEDTFNLILNYKK